MACLGGYGVDSRTVCSGGSRFVFRVWYWSKKAGINDKKKANKKNRVKKSLYCLISLDGIPPPQTSIYVSRHHYHHPPPEPALSPLPFHSPTRPPPPPQQGLPPPSPNSRSCWEIYSTPTPAPPINRLSTRARTHSATGRREFPRRATSRIGSGDSARTASRLRSRRGPT